MARWKNSAVLTVSALAVLGLAACGSKDAPSTVEEKPSGLALMASDAKGSIQKAADAAGKTTSLTIAMEGKQEGEAVKGAGTVALGSERKAEVTVEDPKEGTTTVRVIGTAFYIQVPAADQADMGGKKWFKIDSSAAGEAGVEAMTNVVDDIDPAMQLKPLLTAETVTVVGEEAVNGAQTVHYAVTMPVAPYLAAFPESVRAATEKMITKLGVKEVKTELWIDEQYQVRRGRSFLNDANDMVVNFTDFNKPVTIDVPPAAETADFADLLKGLQG
ncbi:hypothetical protein [Micromonospora pisi]|uniref:hypothetical protein n=1 Tax=Micromonospora pisi TaxID=589240 RepID=UPI0011C38F2B|nr:hypothetical protein [Micromonospora pisi]